MKQILGLAVTGFFVAVVFAIVFVQAGRSGQSGGQQSATILDASGSAISNVAKGLEGAG